MCAAHEPRVPATDRQAHVSAERRDRDQRAERQELARGSRPLVGRL